MNYAAIYDRLIERALSRKIVKPFDRHHIVPRSLGGLDAKDNIAKLSVREHIFAHVLLAKIHPDNFKLVSCAFRMMHGSRSSKSASWLREKFIEGISGDNNPLRNPETAAKVSSKLKGVPRSEETKRRVSDGLKKHFAIHDRPAYVHTEETKEKIRLAKVGKTNESMKGNKLWLGRKHSEETKAKIRTARLGAKMSEESKEKLSSSKRGKVVSAEARARMSEAGKKRWERERSLSLIEVTQ